jgi:putative ABC transport system permease protein
MRSFRGWRPALRIARREALRARGRSILVLVMIGLPVLAIVALDTLGRTSDVSTRESLDRRLGTADALVMYAGTGGAVNQSPDTSTEESEAPQGDPPPAPTTAGLRSLLGPHASVIELYRGHASVRTTLGVARPEAVGTDLRNPMTRGLFDLRAGRLPRDRSEVVVSQRLADRGFPAGSRLTLADGTSLHVVGVVESTTTRDLNLVVGDAAILGLEATTDGAADLGWLVSRPAGVDWSAVRSLNQHGLFALSRQVVEHPPPASEVTVRSYNGGGLGGAEVAVLGLVVAMALLEVVLLAGPAFAVGARRQQRALALMAATGAEPPHLRQVVLASGVVLGGAAAALGALGGVVLAWVAVPAVQQFSTNRLGPFDMSGRDVAAIAACGFGSALLAAFLPAVLAGRSDVVAVLAGRRGETRPARWSPAVGAFLLAAGVAGSAYGANKANGGEIPITMSAILAVVGMVLLTPSALGGLGRIARMLPLPLRFAVRDAARHRSRTAPAVAAVAATVAGVVALGIGGMSDAAQNRALYTPGAPLGAGVVQAHSPQQPDWQALAAAVHRELPHARTRLVTGVDEAQPVQYDVSPRSDATPSPSGPGEVEGFSTSYGSQLGSAVLVGAAMLPDLGLSGSDLSRARAALARGEVVLFDDRKAAKPVPVTIHGQRFPQNGGEPTEAGSWDGRAVLVHAPGSSQPARAVVPASVARAMGLPVTTTAMLVDRATIDQSAEDSIDEALGGLDDSASMYVERGYQDDSTRVILLLLGCIGGALVLGGTLTATFLALSDARPDFATMGAVGADPRTRRTVGAAYAGTIGVVGAVLGAAVGFVPGIAVTFPLTSSSWAGPGATTTTGERIAGHYLDVPWLLVLGLVVVLPLLTAVVVGLASRARLPMVSRLS